MTSHKQKGMIQKLRKKIEHDTKKDKIRHQFLNPQTLAVVLYEALTMTNNGMLRARTYISKSPIIP